MKRNRKTYFRQYMAKKRKEGWRVKGWFLPEEVIEKMQHYRDELMLEYRKKQEPQ